MHDDCASTAGIASTDLVSEASPMVCVFGVFDDFVCQEPVCEGIGTGKATPAVCWVQKVWTKQRGLEVVHVPACALQV